MLGSFQQWTSQGNSACSLHSFLTYWSTKRFSSHQGRSAGDRGREQFVFLRTLSVFLGWSDGASASLMVLLFPDLFRCVKVIMETMCVCLWRGRVWTEKKINSMEQEVNTHTQVSLWSEPQCEQLHHTAVCLQLRFVEWPHDMQPLSLWLLLLLTLTHLMALLGISSCSWLFEH